MDFKSVDAAIGIFGEHAKEFVRLTLKDADTFMAEIKAGIEKGEALPVGLAAHSLKSILGQVGAPEIAALAYEIEKAGKSSDLAGCRKAAPVLETAYAELRVYLEETIHHV